MTFLNPRRRNYILAILFGVSMSTSMVAHAVTKENAVKAGFIYNFSKFTVWPDGAGDSANFNLCIIGDDQLDGALEALYGKEAANKPLVLRRHVKDDALNTCHMAFVTKGQKESIQRSLSKLRNLPILTVSDRDDFIENGGMIGLIRDGERVGFEVDIKAVNAAGLYIGAQLLKLAKEVKGLE